MSARRRNNVLAHGREDAQPMLFAHGFGCDQNMWRYVWPAFAEDYRTVLFDHVGAGGSDTSAFDRERYGSLQGYAEDVLEICRELDLHDVVFVGHSVSATIGLLAAAAEPDRFGALVLLGPSPRYVDDEGYTGGFTREDIEELLDSLDSNYLGWSSAMAPVIMGNEDRPRARRRADEQLLPRRPGDRSSLRSRDVPLRQSRGSRASEHPLADLAVLPRCDRARSRRRVRAPSPRRKSSGSDAGEWPLPEPQRPRGDDRGDQIVPHVVGTPRELLQESAEELFEDAPCGYLSTDLDGTILKVNRTFEAWTGLNRERLLAGKRFQDLLSPGGRIYHETHFSPLLQMQGSVREIAVELIRADGSRLPALINSVLRRDEHGRPRLIRTTVFDATDRRRYERELLQARRREQEIAQQLQRSLLSGALPVTAELEVGVAYNPGVSGLEVGGDWYDAFWPEDGVKVGLVVGDVVGRGLQAASSMGQLRSAVRALAFTGLRPGALLGALDGYSRRHDVGRMATVAYAELDLSSGTLRFACAGHLPPVILAPGEAPCFAWEGRSTPIDSYATGEERSEAVMRLQSGATILLYTDGLIERRSRSLDEGMKQLLAVVDTHRERPAASLAERIAGELRESEHTDDVCLLVAHRTRITRAAGSV